MKILYVTTISNTINAFLIPHIKQLLDEGHQVDIACNIERDINSKLTTWGCTIYNIAFQRSPINKSNYKAYIELKRLIKKNCYDLVHTHTPVASTYVRLACRKLKNVKVFYTAHGFHFFNGAPYKNWLMYYPIERYLSKYTDVLITINKEDYKRASKAFKAGKVHYIPGIGLDVTEISNVMVDKSLKRKEIGVPEQATVILSVGELNKNKNHEIIIKAISKIKNPHIYYVICGKGEMEKYLRNLSNELGVEDRVMLLGYRSDIAEILKVVDLFVFPSYREGLPVSLMEAMAAGLPIICSNIRGNSDLIENHKGGYLVDPNNMNAFAKYIELFIERSDKISDMSLYNKEKVKNYSISNIINKMKEIYTNTSMY